MAAAQSPDQVIEGKATAQTRADLGVTNAAAAQGTANTARTEAAAAQTTANGAAAQNTVQDAQIGVLQQVTMGQTTRLNATDTLNNAQNSRLGSLEAFNQQIGGRVDALVATTNQDRINARRGTAAALAIGQAPLPSEPGKTSYLFNLATFRGEQAVGASLAHRLNTELPFAITLGVAHAGGKNFVAKVGVAGEF